MGQATRGVAVGGHTPIASANAGGGLGGTDNLGLERVGLARKMRHHLGAGWGCTLYPTLEARDIPGLLMPRPPLHNPYTLHMLHESL